MACWPFSTAVARHGPRPLHRDRPYRRRGRRAGRAPPRPGDRPAAAPDDPRPAGPARRALGAAGRPARSPRARPWPARRARAGRDPPAGRVDRPDVPLAAPLRRHDRPPAAADADRRPDAPGRAAPALGGTGRVTAGRHPAGPARPGAAGRLRDDRDRRAGGVDLRTASARAAPAQGGAVTAAAGRQAAGTRPGRRRARALALDRAGPGAPGAGTGADPDARIVHDRTGCDARTAPGRRTSGGTAGARPGRRPRARAQRRGAGRARGRPRRRSPRPRPPRSSPRSCRACRRRASRR
jgi:hypothetical protein